MNFRSMLKKFSGDYKTSIDIFFLLLTFDFELPLFCCVMGSKSVGLIHIQTLWFDPCALVAYLLRSAVLAGEWAVGCCANHWVTVGEEAPTSKQIVNTDEQHASLEPAEASVARCVFFSAKFVYVCVCVCVIVNLKKYQMVVAQQKERLLLL